MKPVKGMQSWAVSSFGVSGVPRLARYSGLAQTTVRIEPIRRATMPLSGRAPIRMAVNVSPRQLKDPPFAQRVERVLAETGLAPRYLELEITESALMDDLGSVNAMLQGFKRAGIFISLDDFGTGYSSLSYLKRFPIDKLKIDQSFVRDVLTDVDDAGLVRAVVAMARALRLTVIAEGVETQGQLEFLRADGCNEVQGYHIARPMPAGHVPDIVHRYNSGARVRGIAPAIPPALPVTGQLHECASLNDSATP